MKPMRGPFDYGAYPRRPRRDPAAGPDARPQPQPPADEAAASQMQAAPPEAEGAAAPHLPRHRLPPHAAEDAVRQRAAAHRRVLLRPHERWPAPADSPQPATSLHAVQAQVSQSQPDMAVATAAIDAAVADMAATAAPALEPEMGAVPDLEPPAAPQPHQPHPMHKPRPTRWHRWFALRARRQAPVTPQSLAQARKWRRRWRAARRVALALTGVAIVELLAAALTSPRYAVREVEVTGSDITTPEEIAPLQERLIGQNWILAGGRAAAREAENLPAVDHAQVARVFEWPLGFRLQLRLEERTPFARVGAGAQWWVVDRKGVPFRPATPHDTTLYAVTGPRLRPQRGQALPRASWEPVVQFAGALEDEQKQGGRWTLRRIYFDKSGSASLRLANGEQDKMLVRLGADRWPDKLQRARQALAYFEETGRHASALNLISFTRPTWTPHGEQAAPAEGMADTVAPPAASAPNASAPTATAHAEGTPAAT